MTQIDSMYDSYLSTELAVISSAELIESLSETFKCFLSATSSGKTNHQASLAAALAKLFAGNEYAQDTQSFVQQSYALMKKERKVREYLISCRKRGYELSKPLSKTIESVALSFTPSEAQSFLIALDDSIVQANKRLVAHMRAKLSICQTEHFMAHFEMEQHQDIFECYFQDSDEIALCTSTYQDLATHIMQQLHFISHMRVHESICHAAQRALPPIGEQYSPLHELLLSSAGITQIKTAIGASLKRYSKYDLISSTPNCVISLFSSYMYENLILDCTTASASPYPDMQELQEQIELSYLTMLYCMLQPNFDGSLHATINTIFSPCCISLSDLLFKAILKASNCNSLAPQLEPVIFDPYALAPAEGLAKPYHSFKPQVVALTNAKASSDEVQDLTADAYYATSQHKDNTTPEAKLDSTEDQHSTSDENSLNSYALQEASVDQTVLQEAAILDAVQELILEQLATANNDSTTPSQTLENAPTTSNNEDDAASELIEEIQSQADENGCDSAAQHVPNEDKIRNQEAAILAFVQELILQQLTTTDDSSSISEQELVDSPTASINENDAAPNAEPELTEEIQNQDEAQLAHAEEQASDSDSQQEATEEQLAKQEAAILAAVQELILQQLASTDDSFSISEQELVDAPTASINENDAAPNAEPELTEEIQNQDEAQLVHADEQASDSDSQQEAKEERLAKQEAAILAAVQKLILQQLATTDDSSSISEQELVDAPTESINENNSAPNTEPELTEAIQDQDEDQLAHADEEASDSDSQQEAKEEQLAKQEAAILAAVQELILEQVITSYDSSSISEQELVDAPTASINENDAAPNAELDVTEEIQDQAETASIDSESEKVSTEEQIAKQEAAILAAVQELILQQLATTDDSSSISDQELVITPTASINEKDDAPNAELDVTEEIQDQAEADSIDSKSQQVANEELLAKQEAAILAAVQELIVEQIAASAKGSSTPLLEKGKELFASVEAVSDEEKGGIDGNEVAHDDADFDEQDSLNSNIDSELIDSLSIYAQVQNQLGHHTKLLSEDKLDSQTNHQPLPKIDDKQIEHLSIYAQVQNQLDSHTDLLKQEKVSVKSSRHQPEFDHDDLDHLSLYQQVQMQLNEYLSLLEQDNPENEELLGLNKDDVLVEQLGYESKTYQELFSNDDQLSLDTTSTQSESTEQADDEVRVEVTKANAATPDNKLWVEATEPTNDQSVQADAQVSSDSVETKVDNNEPLIAAETAPEGVAFDFFAAAQLVPDTQALHQEVQHTDSLSHADKQSCKRGQIAEAKTGDDDQASSNDRLLEPTIQRYSSSDQQVHHDVIASDNKPTVANDDSSLASDASHAIKGDEDADKSDSDAAKADAISVSNSHVDAGSEAHSVRVADGAKAQSSYAGVKADQEGDGIVSALTLAEIDPEADSRFEQSRATSGKVAAKSSAAQGMIQLLWHGVSNAIGALIWLIKSAFGASLKLLGMVTKVLKHLLALIFSRKK